MIIRCVSNTEALGAMWGSSSSSDMAYYGVVMVECVGVCVAGKT